MSDLRKNPAVGQIVNYSFVLERVTGTFDVSYIDVYLNGDSPIYIVRVQVGFEDTPLLAFATLDEIVSVIYCANLLGRKAARRQLERALDEKVYGLRVSTSGLTVPIYRQ